MRKLEIAQAGETLAHYAHGAALASGWWTHAPTGLDLALVIRDPQTPEERLLAGALVAQKLALVHSEVSEGLEGHRKGLRDDKLPQRPMIEVELADAVIRIADLAGAMGLDLGGAIADKMEYNASRADHKPENRAKDSGKSY